MPSQAQKHLSEMRRLPIRMTNLDQTIGKGLAEALKDEPGKVYAQHAAWNFCGWVWFEEDGLFRELVQRYGADQGVWTAPTLEKLMDVVNNEFGWE